MKLQSQFTYVSGLIVAAKQRAYQAVNHELVTLYWTIGEYLHQQVSSNAWGKAVIKELAAFIAQTEPNSKGFSAQNLWRMKQFYETYKDDPKLSALLREIPWTHHTLIFSACKTPGRTHFKCASEADLLMPSQVRRWLTERAELWPAVKFSQDITLQVEPLAPRSEPLPWHLLVPGAPELKAMQAFEKVFVVWADGPALYFQGQSGDEVVVDLGDKGFKGVTLHRDRVHRCRWRE